MQARRYEAGQGKAKQARHCLARHGATRQGNAGDARRGTVWSGKAGVVVQGEAQHGQAKQAMQSEALWGPVRHGKAGKVKTSNLKGKNMRKLNSKVNDELNVMYRRDGELRASVVLKAATPVASPLHNCFTWDDKKAANQFRLVESRNLITACVIVDAKGALEPLLHIPSIKKGEGVYRTATAIVQSESEYERSLREAESSVQTAMTRVAYLVKALRASKQHVDKLPKGQAALRSLELAQHTLQDMQVGDGEA